MIRHVALFRFRPEVTPAQRESFHAAAAALADAIPAVRSATSGPALGLHAGFDYVLMVDVDDARGFAAYKEHPAHQRFIEEHSRPCVAETARAQVAL